MCVSLLGYGYVINFRVSNKFINNTIFIVFTMPWSFVHVQNVYVNFYIKQKSTIRHHNNGNAQQCTEFASKSKKIKRSRNFFLLLLNDPMWNRACGLFSWSHEINNMWILRVKWKKNRNLRFDLEVDPRISYKNLCEFRFCCLFSGSTFQQQMKRCHTHFCYPNNSHWNGQR